mmetsp:Transcript_3077/g.10115  ORF Transcript_3077/g.10115 Transcript_3077/m.10115 type:complete len:240 (+) Transcript_3077:447-1166(+)
MSDGCGAGAASDGPWRLRSGPGPPVSWAWAGASAPEKSCSFLRVADGQWRRSKLEATTSHRMWMPRLFSRATVATSATSALVSTWEASRRRTEPATAAMSALSSSCCTDSWLTIWSARASILASTATTEATTSSSCFCTVGHHRPVNTAHAARPPTTTPAVQRAKETEGRREDCGCSRVRLSVVSRSSLADSSETSGEMIGAAGAAGIAVSCSLSSGEDAEVTSFTICETADPSFTAQS